MKTSTRLLVALFVAAGLTIAAAPANAAPVVIFDATGTSLSSATVAEAARDWSKNTGISVTVGSCTYGANCVKFATVDFACGKAAPVGGCAYGKSDGVGSWCQVEVSKWVWNPSVASWKYTDELVTKHEAGHCIFRLGGLSQSLHLDPPALMSATHSSSPTLKEATLTSIDRRFTKNLFS